MITLRAFNNNDSELLVNYLNNSQVTQYITSAIPQPYTAQDAQWWISHSQQSSLIKAIEYQGEFVGCISAQRGDFEYYRSAELGYWVAQKFWGKGIATIAVKNFSEWLFTQTDILRLQVSVVSLNKASNRVLAKNNFTCEGMRKHVSYKNGQFFDEELWSLLKSDEER
ncbi:GNAT family protein [Thalassotalea sp. 1_MG-2023]|uniref:GNAT family N-acetyltransferase n=1 Tax=Thalassotalea sp. 1_MG-2023 TaxID=3062680 RepID=UPI0026E348F8|nr:GNAT family protein [Thalassotalea sp. 1_MG-2023]MDO6427432.1 GNAT family protein [Thalassotalea sp. 1_MG-2023]